ncbi:LON peptidase substrate-binding domain-containing protein [Sphingopyxis yananensis]|jgi:Lon protease-like protein|uniref:LON peptidase substrate-binding domain-containing protein n=1 Tax=Sphingopyxis yananensis TaxID=2886687 RepID=UPI001D119CC3|nr:LON peptidase substrate-binding domain-containing protein [Sphingopyxis yananensis]MCC2601663.1 LON peptidase substrate-binding domain-containing protein [Sphingopyxis yananensis]
MTDTAPSPIQRIAVFPLSGAVLFPGLQLPLHIFEPRYRAMVQDVLIRDRQIGMIQPRPNAAGASAEHPPLYDIGCLGRITDVEALEDGRFNIVLEGVSRFRVLRELETSTLFRQVEAQLDPTDRPDDILASIERASLEREARRFAERQGYMVDWDAVTRLDDEMLVNGIAQVAPFDAASKQAMLESQTISDRCELLVQLMQFFSRIDNPDNNPTLQ